MVRMEFRVLNSSAADIKQHRTAIADGVSQENKSYVQRFV